VLESGARRGWSADGQKRNVGANTEELFCVEMSIKKSTLGVELQRQRTEGVVLFFRLVSLLILGKLRRGCKL
jgi:hypothetical protein